MESMNKLTFFNELTVDLNDETFFSRDIYERSRENPNINVSYACDLSNDSLDAYTKQLSEKILLALRA